MTAMHAPAASSPTRPRWRRRLGVALHVVGAVGGGYAWSVALVLALGSSLAAAGMPRSEAVVLASMLGFVAYMLIALWAFSTRSTLRMLLILAGSGAVLFGLHRALVA